MKNKAIKVKAYALFSNNDLMIKFDHVHNVFAPRIYNTKEGARNVARNVKSGGEISVVPCIITLKK